MRVSWFCLGRLGPVLDGARAGRHVNLFRNLTSQRMEDSVLGETERFEGRSEYLVVLLGYVV